MGYLSAVGIPDEQERLLAGSLLIGSLWYYAAAVFYPLQPIKRLGLYRPPQIGPLPPGPDRPGLGAHFSLCYPFPVLLEARPEHYDLVDEFDHVAHEYETFIKPFSEPVMAEALRVMRPYFTPSSRVIDTSCGAGTEALLLALMTPEGEVVATDLAAEMVQTTFQRARAAGIGNMAFLQADVARLPVEFTAMFDITFCSLAFHHYPDPLAAAREIYRILRPGGFAFVVDAGPQWFKLMSNWLAKWADPGWIGFHSGDEFKTMFEAAGFSQFHWQELLPGMGLVVAMK
jgi:ubiquinone/menaquinone biosynthesis C-methylase UbiE